MCKDKSPAAQAEHIRKAQQKQGTAFKLIHGTLVQYTWCTGAHTGGGWRYLEAILQCRVAISPAKELFLPPTNSLGRLFGEPKFLPPLQINFFADSQGGSGLSMTALILLTAISPPISSTNIRNRVDIWWKRFKHKMVALKQTKIVQDKKSSQYRIIYLIISTEYCLIFKICTLSLVNSYDRWIACKTQWGKCTFVQIAHCALHHVVVLLWNAVQSTQLL